MADYTINFSAGNNLVSIPLDMRPDTYENNPSLMTQFSATELDSNGNYNWKFIILSGDGAQGLFNIDGSWEGNLTQILPTKSYWIFSRSTISKTFTGNGINPYTLEYTFRDGTNNFISFPFTSNKSFGVGGYGAGDTPSTEYAINRRYLKGSGDPLACITRFAGDGLTRDYDGSGSNSSDWSGNITQFEEGKGYYIKVDTVGYPEITVPLWKRDSVINLSDKDGSHSAGDHAFDYPSGSQIISSIDLDTGFKIVDESGNNILNMDSSTFDENDVYTPNDLAPGWGSDKSVSVTDNSQKVLAIYPYYKINTLNSYPLWGCRGGLYSGLFYNSQNLGSQIKHTLSGIPIDYGDTPIHLLPVGFPTETNILTSTEVLDTNIDNNQSSNYSGIEAPEASSTDTTHLSMYKGGIGTMEYLNNMAYLSYQLSITNMSHDYVGNAVNKFIGFHGDASSYYSTYGANSRISLVIYDPDRENGERFRHCKYYPHPDDEYHSNSSSTSKFIDDSDYSDVFFESDGTTRKYSSSQGQPYAPGQFAYLPYELKITGEANLDHYITKLHGILEVL